ncbi:MAG TPA: acylphosphatase [Steroidobacteraceae bacterium]
MSGRRFLVSGRVQGVFYRGTVAQYARELVITGHAHNLADGRVEVVAFGTPEALQELERRLWVGSSASKVTSVVSAEVAHAAPDRFQTG